MNDDAKVKVLHVDGSESWAVARWKHPATFSKPIVDVMANELVDREWPGMKVLDPFAGQGEKLALIESLARGRGRRVAARGVEIEPEWAACAAFGDVLVGDSTKLPAKWSRSYGAVITSPCYGNRFADSHTPNDACTCRKVDGVVVAAEPDPKCDKCKGSGLSPRRSYTHDLGHALTENNAGAMHYGDAYRVLHRAVWAETWRVLKPGGLFLMNIKDHVRGGKRVRVMEWHRRTILKLGFVPDGRSAGGKGSTILIPLKGLTYGANRERVSNEVVYAFRKPEASKGVRDV